MVGMYSRAAKAKHGGMGARVRRTAASLHSSVQHETPAKIRIRRLPTQRSIQRRQMAESAEDTIQSTAPFAGSTRLSRHVR